MERLVSMCGPQILAYDINFSTLENDNNYLKMCVLSLGHDFLFTCCQAFAWYKWHRKINYKEFDYIAFKNGFVWRSNRDVNNSINWDRINFFYYHEYSERINHSNEEPICPIKIEN